MGIEPSAGSGGESGGAAGGEAGGQAGDGGSAGDAAGTSGAGAEGGGSPACLDVYAARPNGRKPIPADAQGNITTTELTSDTIWQLTTRMFVPAGQTLTIQPCTLIEASPSPSAGALIVVRGAKLDAVGAADAPIVFTNPTRTPWGGVVILGAAPVAPRQSNQANPSYNFFEGTDARATYGGSDPTDDSGELAYVRIEFAGDTAAPSSDEFAGLALAGTGSGTRVHHVMVKDVVDDCFTWQGGTSSSHHLICQAPGDDQFDIDEGYRGQLQYLFGRTLFEDNGSSGLEIDGNAVFPTAASTRLSRPLISNLTSCGTKAPGAVPTYGALLRRPAQGSALLNAILTGWTTGLDVRDDAGSHTAPLWSWTHSRLFAQHAHQTGDDGESDDDGGFSEAQWIASSTGNVVGGAPPPGFDCYAATPMPPTTPIAGGTPPAGFDASATFVGAFGAEDWARGSWVRWD
jgi:hypothetical protein